MRVLILTGSPAYARDSLQLFAEQIVAGPDWPDAQTLDGCWLSLRTPAGEYDLAELLAKIPTYQRPDALVCLVDARWRNQPRNLRSFAGTKILVLSDRADEEPAMADLFTYVGREAFDRVMFLKDQAQLVRFLTGAVPGLPAGLHDASRCNEALPPAEQARAV
ncbi:MAG: hypothetical protein ACOZE5_06085 [Verrucomicrobiota bacterium]